MLWVLPNYISLEPHKTPEKLARRWGGVLISQPEQKRLSHGHLWIPFQALCLFPGTRSLSDRFLARSLLAGVAHLETLTLLSPASERPTRSLASQGPRPSCLPSTAELSHSLPLNSTELFPFLTRVLSHDTLTTLTVQLQYLGKGKTTKAALNPLPVSSEARLAGVPGRHSGRGD